jgi:hypothetical protein
MSTGGAAIKATMKQIVAASRVGTIRVPNQPTYKRLSVEVIQEQNCSQVLLVELRCAIVAVIFVKRVSKNSGGTERYRYSYTTLQCRYERLCLTSP